MTRELWVLSICDTEPDRECFGGAPVTQRVGKQEWRGVTEGLPAFFEQCSSMRDDDGVPFVLTLFVRSDLQIAEFCGTHGWAVSKFMPLWDHFIKKGHEIGWHPHFWKWSDKLGKWYQEMYDSQWMLEECLRQGYSDFKQYLPVNISRMGWQFHNNFSMQQIDKLGIIADFSGLAHLSYGIKKGKPVLDRGVYDWSLTPSSPYYPSKTDYRRPATDGEQRLSIMEIPQNSLKLSIMLTAVNALKNIVRRDSLIVRRREIPMYSRKLFVKEFIKQHIRHPGSANTPTILSWHLHADDFLSSTKVNMILTNIKLLKYLTKTAGIKLKFKTASQIAEYFRKRAHRQDYCMNL